jgi:hypothetical protein
VTITRTLGSDDNDTGGDAEDRQPDIRLARKPGRDWLLNAFRICGQRSPYLGHEEEELISVRG